MAKKRLYIAGCLILIMLAAGSWLSSGATKSLKDMEAEIQALKEENLKLKQQIQELNAKIDLLVSRIEKLEAEKSPAKPLDSFEEKPVVGNNNLPVIKIEPNPSQPVAKVIEIIDEDKKNSASQAKAEPKKDVVADAKKLIQDKKYAEAEKLIKDRLSQKPDAKEACNLLYYLGEAQAGLGKSPDAAKSYSELADKYPACEYSAEALFKSGELYEKMGDKDKAQKLYQDLISLYPFSKYASLAEEKLKK